MEIRVEGFAVTLNHIIDTYFENEQPGILDVVEHLKMVNEKINIDSIGGSVIIYATSVLDVQFTAIEILGAIEAVNFTGVELSEKETADLLGSIMREFRICTVQG